MKLTLVIALGLFLAWLANAVGLAPIIGAFAAGLVLDPAFLEDFEHPEIVAKLQPFAADLPTAQRARFETVLAKAREHHHQALIEPLGHFTVPVFFVYTGMQVDLAALADLNVVLVALALTLAAFVGKEYRVRVRCGTRRPLDRRLGHGATRRGRPDLCRRRKGAWRRRWAHVLGDTGHGDPDDPDDAASARAPAAQAGVDADMDAGVDAGVDPAEKR